MGTTSEVRKDATQVAPVLYADLNTLDDDLVAILHKQGEVLASLIEKLNSISSEINRINAHMVDDATLYGLMGTLKNVLDQIQVNTKK